MSLTKRRERFVRRQFLSAAEFVYRLNRMLGVLCGYAVLIMNFVVFYAVIMRYLFDRPPTWSTETSVFLLMFIIFIPLGMVTQNDAHIAVDFVLMRLKKRAVNRLQIINCFLGAGFAAVLLWQTVILVVRAFQREWVTIEMGTPLGYPLLILPVGSAVLLLSLLSKGIALVLGWETDEEGVGT